MLPSDTHFNIVREAVRLAEKQLDAQLTIIGALAQRAGALSGVLGAGATAMLGAEILMLNALKINLGLGAFLAALIAPMVMFTGCALCGMAAGTSTFQIAGNYPASWQGNITEDDLKDALIGELNNYQGYILENDAIINLHAEYLRRGLRFGFTSPIVLATIGIVFFYYH